MDNYKVGDAVSVRGRIEEIRQTSKGINYLIRIDDAPTGYDIVLVPEESIAE